MLGKVSYKNFANWFFFDVMKIKSVCECVEYRDKFNIFNIISKFTWNFICKVTKHIRKNTFNVIVFGHCLELIV